MPTAEIITIGTELLLGEIVDTNTQFIARLLNANGVDLYRSQTVGDNVDRIAKIICEAWDRCDIIITTGGLGPTIDDPTREAVANAFSVDLEYQEILWDQIQERFENSSENRLRIIVGRRIFLRLQHPSKSCRDSTSIHGSSGWTNFYIFTRCTQRDGIPDEQ